MKRIAYAAVLATTLLGTPVFADDEDQKPASKIITSSEGQVVIEINGQPQIIDLNGSPDVLKKQLQKVTDKLSKNSGKSKNSSAANSQSSSGSYSVRTIIVGPDGVVTDEKVEKTLDGKMLKDKEFMKNVPESVRKQIEAAMKKAGGDGKIQLKIDVGSKPGAIMQNLDLGSLLKDAGKNLPADIRKQVMEAMKGMDAKKIASGNFQGHAIVIGPDGNKQEFRFGDDQDSKGGLEKMPPTGKPGAKKMSGGDDKISQTLKKILARLDKIESELETLKKVDQGSGK